MTNVCPYCAATNVKQVCDGRGEVGWCQQCHHTWMVRESTPEGSTPEASTSSEEPDMGPDSGVAEES